jgi:hypothetical protein
MLFQLNQQTAPFVHMRIYVLQSDIKIATIYVSTYLQGCQMVYFQTKNPYMGKLWRALKWVRLVYSFAIWNLLLPLGTFYGHLAI